jgi:hypothetical protein
LLEVVVALTVGAMVIVGARAVLATIADQERMLAANDEAQTRSTNGGQLLRRLLLHARAGSERDATFSGSATEISVDTWCLTPRGWSERCRVRLALAPATSESNVSSVVAHLSSGERLILKRVSTSARFAYLERTARGGLWISNWGPSAESPHAVGILGPSDTLIFRAGKPR